MVVVDSKIVGSVYEESDYTKFKFLDGNRGTNEVHLKRLKLSVEEYGQLKCPIMVNSKMEIVDGQHRYAIARALGLPIYFIINDDYGIEEVKILNTNMKNWGKSDYLKMYCDQKKPEYLLFEKYRNHFSWTTRNGNKKYTFTNTAIEELLAANMSKDKYFEKGKLIIRDYDDTLNIGIYIREIGESCDIRNYKSLAFVRTMNFFLRHPQFDRIHFAKKLKLYSKTLVGCSRVEEYRAAVSEIYNKNSRNKIKFF